MNNNLIYADDTVILFETEHELQHLMDIVVLESEQKGLFLTELNHTPWCSANHHPYLYVILKLTESYWSR